MKKLKKSGRPKKLKLNLTPRDIDFWIGSYVNTDSRDFRIKEEKYLERQKRLEKFFSNKKLKGVNAR